MASRAIKDRLFYKAVEELGLDVEQFEGLPELFGNVKVNVAKVGISTPEIPMVITVDLESLITLRYRALLSSVADKMCYLEKADGSKMDISSSRLSVIRTLAIEQINACGSYSRIMAACAIEVVNAAINKKDKVDFVIDDDDETLTALERYVIGVVDSFVKKYY